MLLTFSPDHDELRERAAAYALGILSAEERLQFEAHLSACRRMRSRSPFARPGGRRARARRSSSRPAGGRPRRAFWRAYLKEPDIHGSAGHTRTSPVWGSGPVAPCRRVLGSSRRPGGLFTSASGVGWSARADRP